MWYLGFNNMDRHGYYLASQSGTHEGQYPTNYHEEWALINKLYNLWKSRKGRVAKM